ETDYSFTCVLETCYTYALVAIRTEDVTWSMPPLPHWYQGLPAVTDFAARVPMANCGAWRHLPVAANGQPAVALYLSASGGPHLFWSITVLTLRDNRSADLTTYIGHEHATPSGLS